MVSKKILDQAKRSGLDPNFSSAFKEGYKIGFDDAKKEVAEWAFNKIVESFLDREIPPTITQKLLEKLKDLPEEDEDD